MQGASPRSAENKGQAENAAQGAPWRQEGGGGQKWTVPAAEQTRKPPSIKAESGPLPSAVILSTPFVHPPAYGIQGNPMGRMGRGGGVGIKKNPCKNRGFVDH